MNRRTASPRVHDDARREHELLPPSRGLHYHWTVALVELLFFTAAGWCGAPGNARRR